MALSVVKDSPILNEYQQNYHTLKLLSKTLHKKNLIKYSYHCFKHLVYWRVLTDMMETKTKRNQRFPKCLKLCLVIKNTTQSKSYHPNVKFCIECGCFLNVKVNQVNCPCCTQRLRHSSRWHSKKIIKRM